MYRHWSVRHYRSETLPADVHLVVYCSPVSSAIAYVPGGPAAEAGGGGVPLLGWYTMRDATRFRRFGRLVRVSDA